MPIHLITAQPRTGKTLYMMQLLCDAMDENRERVKRGDKIRPLFAVGVDGLDVTTCGYRKEEVTIWDDAAKWDEMPDDSIMFVDEAWKWFGDVYDARSAKRPSYVVGLAEHGHRGLDFVWTTQMTSQIFPFARGVMGNHTHMVRHLGIGVCTLFQWTEMQDDVKSQGVRDRAVNTKWTYPKRLFKIYKSASGHHVKPNIPWRVAVIPACIIGALVLGWFVYAKMKTGDLNATAQQADSGVAGTASPARSSGGASKPVMTAAEWQKMVTPRIAGIHGSQPLFDGRKALSKPATYCMISGPVESGRCVCYTEQATVIPDVLPARCRRAARFGEYDPFKAPMVAGKPIAPAPGQDEDRDLAGAVAPGDPAAVGSPAMGTIQGRRL